MGVVYAKYDALGGLTARYIQGPGLDRKVGVVPYSGGTPGNTRYFFSTPNGSIHQVMEYDPNLYGGGFGGGTVVDTRLQSAFGEPILPNLSGAATTAATEFGYTGRRRLGNSGLYDYRNRIYDPALGRFLTPDPLGTKPGMNLYGYVNGDPVNSVDPMGLDDEPIQPVTRVPKWEEKEIKKWINDRATLRLFRVRPRPGSFFGPPKAPTTPLEKWQAREEWLWAEVAPRMIPIYGSYFAFKRWRAANARFEKNPTRANAEHAINAAGSFGLSLAIDITLIADLALAGVKALRAASMVTEATAARLTEEPTFHVLGAGQEPRLAYSTANADGTVRNVAEARAILEAHGVEVPDGVFFTPAARFPPKTKAYYLFHPNAEGQTLSELDKIPFALEDLYVGEGRGVLWVKYHPSVLESDEMILGHLGHEVFEINKLRLLSAQGELRTQGDLVRAVGPGIKGNLHDQAWEYADSLVEAFRAAFE